MGWARAGLPEPRVLTLQSLRAPGSGRRVCVRFASGAGWGSGLLRRVAGFAANGSADDATAFAAALGFFGKFGFGARTQDHGRFSGDTSAGVKSCEQNRSAGGTKTEFRSAVCHPGPVPDEVGINHVGNQGADERNSAGRAVYRGESAETISFSRGISETAIAEFRFREVRDIMQRCLRAC